MVESLVRCGAFDFTGERRARLWEGLGPALEHGQRTHRDRELGQGSLFGDGDALPEPRLPEVAEWEGTELLAGEKEMLGFYVTGHPLVEHEPVLRRFASLTLDQLEEAGAAAARGDVWCGGLLGGLRTQRRAAAT